MEGLRVTGGALEGGASQLSPRSALAKVDEYNRTHHIEGMLQQMLVSLFTHLPDDPHTHMVEFVEAHRAALHSPMSAAVKASTNGSNWGDRRSMELQASPGTGRSTGRSRGLDTDRHPRSVISGYGYTTSGDASVRSRLAQDVSMDVVEYALAELDS
jgi:hypothetical protein